jgi:HEAT repeat protein
MFSDENVLVRHQTALVLGRIGGDAATAALQQQLAEETNANVKTAVANALKQLENPKP